MLKPEYLFIWILFHLAAVELPKAISKRGQPELTATEMVNKMQYNEAVKTYKTLKKVKSSNELRSLAVAFMELGQNDTALSLFNYLNAKYPKKVTATDALNRALLLRRIGSYTKADSLISDLKTTAFAGYPILNEPGRSFLDESDPLETALEPSKEVRFRNNNAHYLAVKSPVDNKWWYHEKRSVRTGLMSTIDLSDGQPFGKVMEASNWDDTASVIGLMMENQYLNRNFELTFIDSFGTYYVTTNHRLVNDSDRFLLDIFRFYKSPKQGKYVLESLNEYKWQHNMAGLVMNASQTQGMFYSDMMGGMGKSDLYLCDIVWKDGLAQVTNPYSIGETANTILPDFDPVFVTDNIIAFASEGHVGYGGSDIYFYDLTAYKLINAGKLINSRFDEFAPRYENGRLYWSCDPYGKKSQVKYIDLPLDRIYKAFNPTVEEEDNQVYPEEDTYVQESQSNQGESSQNSEEITGSTRWYDKVESLDLEPGLKFLMLPDSIRLTQAREVTDSSVYSSYRLRNILYPMDNVVCEAKFEMELRIAIELLKRRKDWMVEIRSYTDSRGGTAVNMDLSQKRSDFLKDYFLFYGIEPSQVESEGMGEAFLLNHCSEGVQCSEEEHRRNRRTTLIIKKKTNP